MESRRLALQEPVRLAPYESTWPESFRIESLRILCSDETLIVDVRHIGSTAVPGLLAKPIIDMLVSVTTFNAIDRLTRHLQRIGYEYEPAAQAQSVDRRWFFRHSQGRRTHHLHIVEYGSGAWYDRVRFCELLNSSSDLRVAYQTLKLKLQAQHGSDRNRYTYEKQVFIRQALRAWSGVSRPRDSDTLYRED
jgi:GrpB-like predicted nucleotidyltransferase (UPF0157 family)